MLMELYAWIYEESPQIPNSKLQNPELHNLRPITPGLAKNHMHHVIKRVMHENVKYCATI